MLKKRVFKVFLFLVIFSAFINILTGSNMLKKLSLFDESNVVADAVDYVANYNNGVWIGKDGNLHKYDGYEKVNVYEINSDGTTTKLLYTYELGSLSTNSSYYIVNLNTFYNDLNTVSFICSYGRSGSSTHLLSYAKLVWNGMQYIIANKFQLDIFNGANIQFFRQNCDYVRACSNVYSINGANILYQFNLLDPYGSTDQYGLNNYKLGNDNKIYFKNNVSSLMHRTALVTTATGTISAAKSNSVDWQSVGTIDNGAIPTTTIKLNGSNRTISYLPNGIVTLNGYKYYATTNGLYIPKIPANNTPSFTVSAPVQNQIFSESNTTLAPSISVTDADSDNIICKYFIDSDNTPKDTKNATTGQTVTFNSFDPSKLSDGIHIVKFEVSDGKAVSKKGIVIKVDKSAPKIKISQLVSTENSITITGSAKDNISGLDTAPYNFTIDSTSSGWTANSTFSKSNLIPNTKYSVKMSAKDNIGHISTTPQSSYYTKAQTPSLAVSAKTTSSLEITFNDSNPAYTKYQISVNLLYVDASGKLTPTPAWIGLSNKMITVSGLSSATTYVIKAKAKNLSNVETTLSTQISETTN